MSSDRELPEKCQKCHKSTATTPHKKCRVCQELDLHEVILCDLNRSVQEPEGFACHAFQPILKLTSSRRTEARDSHESAQTPPQKNSLLKLLSSDKIKYERALALQKLDRDPDGIFIDLRYHFAWNVTHRKPVFDHPFADLEPIHDTFLKCSEMVRGFANLLWLAPDHIHLYVESDGELSVERLAQEVKQRSGNTILAKSPILRDRLDSGLGLWDKSYFVQSLG
jgi:REP element-mobilizing transposase RayT